MKRIFAKNTIIKFIALSLVAVMSTTTMCACSINRSNHLQPSDVSDAGAVSQSSASQTSSSGTDSSNISSDSNLTTGNADILSFSFKMDGVDYKIPCDFSEFAKLGYSFEEDSELDGNTYAIGASPEIDGKSLHAQMWNPTDSPKKYSECKVGSIEISLEDKHEVILPGGLKFDETVTAEVVKEKYGEPDSCNEGDGYITLTYEKDTYEDVEFFLYTKENLIHCNSVTFRNFI